METKYVIQKTGLTFGVGLAVVGGFVGAGIGLFVGGFEGAGVGGLVGAFVGRGVVGGAPELTEY